MVSVNKHTHSKTQCLLIQEKSWPYCTCFLQEKDSKQGWYSSHKETKKSKTLWNKPHTLIWCSLFLIPLSNSCLRCSQEKSQGKCDQLIAETCCSRCYSDLKLTLSCGLALDTLSPESLCWTTSCFFSVPGGLGYNSLRTEKRIPQNAAVISSWMLSITVASFITARTLHLSQNQETNLKKDQPVL